MRTVVHLLGPSAGGIRAHVRYLATHPPPGWLTMGISGPPELAPYFHGLPFRATSGLRRITAGRFADLVHVHGLTAAGACFVPGGPPSVLTLHMDVDTQGRTARSPLLRRLAPVVAARADALVAVSERVARAFPGARVIPPASEPLPQPRRNREDVRAELGVSADEVVVLAVARLHPDKGLDTFIEAVRRTEAVGWVAGSGPQRALLEQLASGSGVRLLGFRDDVADLLAAADVFALPSVGEGYGIAVEEAIGSGLPVVATRSGAVPEITTDAALLVPPGDTEAFVDAVTSVVADPDLRTRLTLRARSRTLPSADERVHRVGEVYDEVLA